MTDLDIGDQLGTDCDKTAINKIAGGPLDGAERLENYSNKPAEQLLLFNI